MTRKNAVFTSSPEAKDSIIPWGVHFSCKTPFFSLIWWNSSFNQIWNDEFLSHIFSSNQTWYNKMLFRMWTMKSFHNGGIPLSREVFKRDIKFYLTITKGRVGPHRILTEACPQWVLVWFSRFPDVNRQREDSELQMWRFGNIQFFFFFFKRLYDLLNFFPCSIVVVHIFLFIIILIR